MSTTDQELRRMIDTERLTEEVQRDSPGVCPGTVREAYAPGPDEITPGTAGILSAARNQLRPETRSSSTVRFGETL
ncbi:MAG: hypothetical protein HY791_21745 [Deltaproteobacteria bacterium]|nr:hypothetical protein [Deltaproteobacteria bacterium]